MLHIRRTASFADCAYHTLPCTTHTVVLFLLVHLALHARMVYHNESDACQAHQDHRYLFSHVQVVSAGLP